MHPHPPQKCNHAAECCKFLARHSVRYYTALVPPLLPVPPRNRMKILLLNDDYAGIKGTEFDGEPHGRGGAAIIATGLAESYRAAGHEVYVLTTHQRGSNDVLKEEINSIKVTSLPIRYPKMLRHFLCLWNPSASR